MPEWARDGNEAVRFFYCFSRFEFALKEAGFTKKDQENAEPDWNNFARELKWKIFEELRSDDSAKEIFERPPRKQVVCSDRKLSWCPKDPDFPARPESVQRLLEYVRRVRNNLFHGGKAPGVLDERDKKLIKAAQFVLEKAYNNAPEAVKSAFQNPSDDEG
jgi:hypothetical protein